LSKLIAAQQGRRLQASAEGTCFEIIKGRYSESPNFEVYNKAHSGDPIRVNRVGRKGEMVDQPALSLAVAVQPDVIHGLTAQAGLRGRGFLARPLYSHPHSKVGDRQVGAPPVPEAVRAEYHKRLKALWELPWAVDGHGKLVPTWVEFSAPALLKLGHDALRHHEHCRHPAVTMPLGQLHLMIEVRHVPVR
jgi:hypothetical protein